MSQVLQNLDDLLAVAPSLPDGDSETTRLKIRLDQVLAEYETLRASHADAINAAVAEREERLLEQEEHMNHLRAMHLQNEMILNSAGEGIFGVDRQGRASFVNPAAARLLGWDRDALAGRFLHDDICVIRADGSRPCWRESDLYGVLERGNALSNRYGELRRRDGSTFPIEFTCTPIRDESQVIGAVVTFRDITERRMLEAQLRQAQKLESIGQLAAGIAHEINTPTQYIGDNARFLDEAFRDLTPLLRTCVGQGEVQSPDCCTGVDDETRADVEYLLEEIPKAVQQSLEGVERVAKIVRSMKEFSHIGCDRMQSIDLRAAIESTLTVSRNEWRYVADVITEFDDSLPLVVCLPGDINQVVLNLVVNAAHAIADRVGCSGDKGQITIRAHRVDECVEIQVADTGAGIPSAVQEKIFDPFFTTKEVGRGTGQGLAIARSVIVEKHGGSIRFETELGRGTTFFVRIPLTHPDLNAAEQP